jgi:N-acetylglucosaminyl-diphospho-decaprenol L-rhamnosyltransferase
MLITISIVSHGHGDKVRLILNDINRYKGPANLKVFLTLNAPELESIGDLALHEKTIWPIETIRNSHKRGFAKNHNSAFSNAELGIWCVLNPDIRFEAEDLAKSLDALSHDNVGMVFPCQSSPSGETLDFQRELVTPWSLFKRYVFRSKPEAQRVDWVSGCFMAFRSDVFQKLGGFDEKYFLYCEDVDICLRLQLAGYKMAEADFSIIHDTRRSTLKKWDHFKWHVSSLLKLWCSRVFWVYWWNRHKIRQR